MKSKYIILFILSLVFFCPGLAAYLFYTHPAWINQTTNHGHLLTSREQISVFDREPKWRLVLWQNGDCTSHCRDELERLAKIRLSLGRKLYQVEEVLLLSQSSKALSDTLLLALKANDIKVKILADKERLQHASFGDSPKLFIADPRGYLILSYERDTKSKDIFHDIDLLLKVGKKNV